MKNRDIPDWMDPEVWVGFQKHRKLLKKPMTDRAEFLILKRLEKAKDEYGGGPYVVDSYMKDLDEWNKANANIHSEKVWTMRLTDKLKEASREGLPYYMVLPPLVIGGAAAQRTDAQRQQAKTDAQAILNQ